MRYRKLCRNGPNVSVLGLGCMSLGIADTYTSSLRGDDDAIELIHHALNSGITLLDTADIYGESERLVGRAIADRRERVVLATKFGFTAPATAADRAIDGSAGYVRRSCEASLQRLGLGSSSSTCTTCIGSIRRCRSRKRSGRCPNWCRKGK